MKCRVSAHVIVNKSSYTNQKPITKRNWTDIEETVEKITQVIVSSTTARLLLSVLKWNNWQMFYKAKPSNWSENLLTAKFELNPVHEQLEQNEKLRNIWFYAISESPNEDLTSTVSNVCKCNLNIDIF